MRVIKISAEKSHIISKKEKKNKVQPLMFVHIKAPILSSKAALHHAVAL